MIVFFECYSNLSLKDRETYLSSIKNHIETNNSIPKYIKKDIRNDRSLREILKFKRENWSLRALVLAGIYRNTNEACSNILPL